MNFDVVLGNPPYNSGMDLDFVDLGFEFSTKYVTMITPAKWQTVADDYTGCASKNIDYEGFREKIVPYMSKVVFYTNCQDVFDIEIPDGISYYIIDKNKDTKTTEVVNCCLRQPKLNSTYNRCILHRETLINKGDDIVKHIKNSRKFKFKESSYNSTYEVWTGTMLSGGRLLTNDGNFMCLGISRIIDKSKNEKSSSISSQITFSSNDRSECESFVSWLNTKFTRFFIAINISKLSNILTDDYFRFVPLPPALQGKVDSTDINPWDHIYTDQELYEYFKLKPEHIDIIESLIRERN